MARVKRGTKRRRRHKKILNRAEGFILGRNNIYKRTKETVDRAGVYAYRDRRRRKRLFRNLWVTRLGAATLEQGISYSRFIAALKKSNVELNRKMLSEIAIFDPAGFTAIVSQVKSQAPAV